MNSAVSISSPNLSAPWGNLLANYSASSAIDSLVTIGPGVKQVYIQGGRWSDDVTVVSYRGSQTGPKGYIRALSKRLCEEHPAISTYEGIFGGSPHLKGLRISVADILEQLYLTGSIPAVQRIYSPDVSEDQIKEVIAYAQDFIESAVSSSSEVND